MGHMIFDGYLPAQKPINLPLSTFSILYLGALANWGASILLDIKVPSLRAKAGGGGKKPVSRKSF